MKKQPDAAHDGSKSRGFSGSDVATSSAERGNGHREGLLGTYLTGLCSPVSGVFAECLEVILWLGNRSGYPDPYGRFVRFSSRRIRFVRHPDVVGGRSRYLAAQGHCPRSVDSVGCIHTEVRVRVPPAGKLDDVRQSGNGAKMDDPEQGFRPS